MELTLETKLQDYYKDQHPTDDIFEDMNEREQAC